MKCDAIDWQLGEYVACSVEGADVHTVRLGGIFLSLEATLCWPHQRHFLKEDLMLTDIASGRVVCSWQGKRKLHPGQHPHAWDPIQL